MKSSEVVSVPEVSSEKENKQGKREMVREPEKEIKREMGSDRDRAKKRHRTRPEGNGSSSP